jgi:hypothetical protein
VPAPEDFTFETVELGGRGGNWTGLRTWTVGLRPEHQRDPRFLAFLDWFNELAEAELRAARERPPSMGPIASRDDPSSSTA